MIEGEIPGYTYGTSEVAKSPLSDEAFEKLKSSVGFTDEDVQYLKLAGEILSPQMDAVLDMWYGFLDTLPHIGFYTTDGKGNPVTEYRAATRQRFRQWILDTCNRPYDRAWLDYQHEIGLRHHRSKKNQTDHVDSVPHTPLRYIVTFIYPITIKFKPFLANGNTSAENVEKMHEAWFKSMVLQVTLWSLPYTKDGDF